MWRFIRRVLGWECCTAWTQWERRARTIERPTDLQRDGLIALKVDYVCERRQWLERRCPVCGRVQQRELGY